MMSVSLFGDFTSAGGYINLPPRPWERFDAALASNTPDLASLRKAARERAGGRLGELHPSQAMEILYGTVADRFTHGDLARYNLFSNWALWLLGGVSPRHGYIQDPEALLRYGHSAMCGEVSFVLLRLASMEGIPARHAHLNGHIVMEAGYDGEWHAYDPDLEGVVRDEDGSVLSVEAAARRPDLLRKTYTGRGSPEYTERLVGIYADTRDDRYHVYPPRSFFSPEGHWPGRIEGSAKLARMTLPVALYVAGFALLGAGRKKEG